MGYLCIDVEWNIPADQKGERELISIGAACWDSVSQLTRTYFRLMRPQRMDLVTPTTYKLLNLGPVVLEQAKPCEEILNNFIYTFDNRDYLTSNDPIIFWNREAQEMLTARLTEAGLSLPSSRIVILQDVIDFMGFRGKGHSKMSFEAALERFNVSYRPELLHNSKHDAMFLIDLYDAVYDTLESASASSIRMLHTATSRVLHHPGCRCLKHHSAFGSDRIEALNGWPLCKLCERQDRLDDKAFAESRYITMRKPASHSKRKAAKRATGKPKKSKKLTFNLLDEDSLVRHCESLGIKCQFSVGWVFLRTPVSYWKIKHEGTRVETVLHQSIHCNRSLTFKRKKKTNEGFHQQLIYDKDIYGVVSYIYEHDRHYLYPKYIPSYWKEKRESL